MTITALPAEGTTITTPRGLFIDFRNIMGRDISADNVRALTRAFINVSRAVGADAAITCDSLVAEPVPGDRRSEKLVAGDLYNAEKAKLRVLRLSFAESARGGKTPLAASLILDLRDREAKSAAVTVHAPGMDAAQSVHDLYDALEGLQRKGLLNNINMQLTTRDGSITMNRSSRESKTFSLRF